MAAAITKTLRVWCRVFACDFHHLVLAKEMATLDMLSGGRLEVGLGAGWTAAEYDGLGIPMDSAGTRIERLGEYVKLMRAHWGGEQINVSGTHVNVHGFAGRPLPVQQPHPPIMIGGGAPRILGLAGREADIVSFNFDNSTGKLGAASVATSGLDVTREKIGWVRDGAKDRFDRIELEIGAYFIAVGDHIATQIEPMAARYGVTGDELLSHPHGPVRKCLRDLRHHRRPSRATRDQIRDHRPTQHGRVRPNRCRARRQVSKPPPCMLRSSGPSGAVLTSVSAP